MPNPTIRRHVAVVFAALLLVAAGCSHRNTTGPAADNYLRLAMTAEPTTFDPAMVQDGTTIDMLFQIYEGLVQWTPENKIAPALAKSWDISKDGRTYTFHLRDDAKFHSGDPITADDVAYSLSRSLDPKLASPVAITYLGDIVGAKDYFECKAKTLTGVKVVDPTTVQITIAKPKAYWIDIMTYPTGFVVNKKAVAKDPGGKITDKNTDGSGAFKLDSYQSGVSVELAANTAYYAGAPKIAGQHRSIITDAQTRHSLYVNGDLDIVDETAGSRDADEQDPALKSQIKYFPRASTFYFAFGAADAAKLPQFKDVRVRQAFAYATDKKRIVDVVFAGRRTVAEDILPEGVPGYDPAFKGIPYDPAKAKALLAEAGYPGGKGFPVVPVSYRESYPDVAKTVDLLRQMYQENLGVTVQAQQTEWATLLAANNAGRLPAFHMRWMADYLDPQDFYSILSHTGSEENHLGYSNPKLDALCDAADTEQNEAKRFAMYKDVAKILAQDVPRIPLYYQRDVELVKPWVTDLSDSLMGHLPYKTLSLKR
ncbi:MAG TPA: peptide ABC transporter substrate-binding protein [Capsulimonadaceae bacterium]|jgi:ABC-type transport system substrate-binding protein